MVILFGFVTDSRSSLGRDPIWKVVYWKNTLFALLLSAHAIRQFFHSKNRCFCPESIQKIPEGHGCSNIFSENRLKSSVMAGLLALRPSAKIWSWVYPRKTPQFRWLGIILCSSGHFLHFFDMLAVVVWSWPHLKSVKLEKKRCLPYFLPHML